MKTGLRDIMFRIWYRYVNSIDKNAEVLFMNYGYHDDKEEILLNSLDSHNRYSIQLYHHLASAIDLKNKDVVEIGCGRGGGLNYIARNFSPASAIGVDLDKVAVSFCNRHYQKEGLSFIRGDAQNLSLESNSFDVVLNVESSHRYPDFSAFLSEVKRILRPKGYFLYTDFRHQTDMMNFHNTLAGSEFIVLKERKINNEVVAALNLDDERRRYLVKKLTPRPLHNIAMNFAGVPGSTTYNNFLTEQYVYFSYVLQKA
jgi:ubiquinone/menaquinone biosynthesis C-methylase UbiE